MKCFGPKPESRESGFTLLEGMVSGALLIIVAVALIPAFYSLVSKSQLTNFKIQCNSIVRAKLQEYATGSGAALGTATGLSAVPTGFEYSRMRYQTTAGACSTAATDYGFRETVNGNSPLADTAPTESGLPASLKGFQLWVNIQRYDPRHLINGSPTLDCPSVGTAAAGLSNGYQFSRLGDAVEITVTGMIRTEPAVTDGGRGGEGQGPDTEKGKRAPLGGLRDIDWQLGSAAWRPNPALMCSLRQKVSPPSQLFRYFLGADGRIRRYVPGLVTVRGALSVAPGLEAHYRSIWVSDAASSTNVETTRPVGNIISFAVSPNNDSVYVLKPGSLVLYENCSEGDVTVNGTVFPGTPNCGIGSTQTEIDISAQNIAIESIAVEFGDVGVNTDDSIYGLRNSGPSGFDQEITEYESGSGLFKPTSDYSLPPVPRIKGILLSNSYPQVAKPALFVIDNTCYLGPGGTATGTTYCVSIYGAGDTQMDRVFSDLPVQVEAVSN